MSCATGRATGPAPSSSSAHLGRCAVVALLAVVVTAGCGTGRQAAPPRKANGTTPAPAAGFRVGIVGPLQVDVQGVAPRHGSLDQVAGEPLVLVDARVVGPDAVIAAARANPASHFALVDASARADHVRNLAGIVLRESDAAYLAGVAAALVATGQSGTSNPRVAWVGPEERPLARAFARGVHATAAGVAVLQQWSRPVPAYCKEAALLAVDRGAVVVMAHGGLCASAAAAAAHEQNLPALRLGDFLLPSVAATLVVREATGGVFHGGQDVILDASSGAVGVRTLDPLISAATAAQVRAAAQNLATGTTSSGG